MLHMLLLRLNLYFLLIFKAIIKKSFFDSTKIAIFF